MIKKMNSTHLLSDIIASIVFSSLIIVFIWHYKVAVDFTNVVNILIGVWATLLGFLITAVSILLAIKESKYILALIKAGHFKKIMDAYISNSYLLAITLCFFIVDSITKVDNIIIMVLLLFMSSLSMIRIFTSIRILKKVINLSNDNNEDEA